MENKGTLVIDLDGTICPIKKSDERYEDLKPYDNIIQKLEEYRKKGFRILIFTARQMRTHGGNIGLINVHTSRMTMNWLDKWNVPYDEIIFGKPWPGKGGFYIDDRAIRPDEFLKYNEDELNKMLDDARERITKE